jgi:hypothetical protein
MPFMISARRALRVLYKGKPMVASIIIISGCRGEKQSQAPFKAANQRLNSTSACVGLDI